MEKWIEYILFFRKHIRKEVIIIGGIAIGGILMWIYWRCILCCDRSFQQLIKDGKERQKQAKSEEEQEINAHFSRTSFEDISLSEPNEEEKVVITIEKVDKSNENRKKK